MSRIRIVVLVCILAAGYPAFSQDNMKKRVQDPANLIAEVGLFSSGTSSISSDFTQVKEMSFMEETITSSGKFYFKKEKQLRWEYVDPFSYAIILNNNRIRIVDGGKNKDFDAGSNRMFVEISEIMSGMVDGTLLASDKFTAAWFETPQNYLVELAPVATAMKDYLSVIVLEIDKKDFSVDGLKMVEKSGDFTYISFQNKKFNEAIPEDIFRVD